MTLDEFFKKLAAFKGQFELTSLGYIRHKDSYQCPICAVAGPGNQNCHACDIGINRLHMAASEVVDIMSSADNIQPANRERMLKTLGLTESSDAGTA